MKTYLIAYSKYLHRNEILIKANNKDEARERFWLIMKNMGLQIEVSIIQIKEVV